MERRSKQQTLTARLIELRNAIKRKYKMFKEGTEESELLLERQYKPLIQELRKTTTTPEIKSEPDSFKEEPMDYELTESEEELEEDKFSPQIESTPKTRDITQVLSSPSTTQYVEEYFRNPLTREYMQLFFKDTARKKIIDYTYGPRYTDSDTLMVGDKTLDFDENGNILIGGVNYGESEGLYELLFKKVPDKEIYTENDLQTYKSILHATNAHRDKYKFDGRIKSANSIKYTKIIKTLFRPLSGKGMAWKTTKTHDIIHWDNPNELVDRLRHIAMSTETGNRVHSNEIISIIEELREGGYIRGGGNSRFKALLK